MGVGGYKAVFALKSGWCLFVVLAHAPTTRIGAQILGSCSRTGDLFSIGSHLAGTALRAGS
jgi:hypothetical protein